MSLNRLLPLLVMPLFVFLVLAATGTLADRRWLVGLALGGLWLASTPLVGNAAIRAMEGDAVRRPASEVEAEADAIVVLSTGRVATPGPVPRSEWTDADRFFAGVELYEAGKGPLLVFTGAGGAEGRVPTEGEVLARTAVRLGVPEESIVVTGPVARTEDEAEAVADRLGTLLASRDAPPTILLVTSAFHMPRAASLMERAGLEVTPFPVDFQMSRPRPFLWTDLLPTSSALRDTERAARELLGRAWYAVVR